MGLDQHLPPDWRVAIAVAVAVVAGLGFADAHMEAVAEAAVAPVRAEAVHRKESVDKTLQRIEESANATRDIVEALLADCYARGGCR